MPDQPPESLTRAAFLSRLRQARLPSWAPLLADVYEEHPELRLVVALLVLGGFRRARDCRLNAHDILVT